MPQRPCPKWEYGFNLQAASLLPARSAKILADIKSNPGNALRSMCDTRPIHGLLFGGLTPPDFDHYAGHYRGEPLECLKKSTVQLTNHADDRVGFEPEWVYKSMQNKSNNINDAAFELDMLEQSEPKLPTDEFLVKVVEQACELFESFLEIHPYINGNGHAGRFILIAFLGRYGFWIRDWEINQRPKEPEYSDCIRLHRDGKVEFLQKLVLQCFLNP
jgi:fido (protein-threonine AMPylation protein)